MNSNIEKSNGRKSPIFIFVYLLAVVAYALVPLDIFIDSFMKYNMLDSQIGRDVVKTLFVFLAKMIPVSFVVKRKFLGPFVAVCGFSMAIVTALFADLMEQFSDYSKQKNSSVEVNLSLFVFSSYLIILVACLALFHLRSQEKEKKKLEEKYQKPKFEDTLELEIA